MLNNCEIRRIRLKLLISAFMIFIIFNLNHNSFSTSANPLTLNESSFNYISINGDDELLEFVNTNVIDGRGTKDSPYLIQNYNLAYISLQNIVETHIIIRDNNLAVGINNQNFSSIYLVNVQNLEIRNNIIQSNKLGISAFSVSNIKIKSNLIKINDNCSPCTSYGIYLGEAVSVSQSSNDNLIENNYIDSYHEGVIINGDRNNLTDNLIDYTGRNYGGQWGQGVIFSGNENILNQNTIRKKYGYGLLLANSNNSIISENNFIDNSLSLSYNGFEYESQAADFADIDAEESMVNTFSKNYWETFLSLDISDSSNIYEIETNTNNPGDLTPVDLAYPIPTIEESIWEPSNEKENPFKELIFPKDSRIVLLTFLVSIGSIFSYFYFISPWLKSNKGLKIEKQHLKNGVTTVFGKKMSMFYLLFTQDKNEDTEFVSELKKSISTEIFDYKFLLQPIRMAMIKLLYENTELTSIEIKNTLEIKWGEYNTHIRALKAKNYVMQREEFINGSVKHMISIEIKGIDEYSKLKEILVKFVDSTEIEIESFNFNNKNDKDEGSSQGFDVDELS